MIEGAGIFGAVEEIQIFTTKLTTPDNKIVIVPNSKIEMCGCCTCDQCDGDEFHVRSDDSEPTFRSRLRAYHKDTEPLISYYGQLRNEDAPLGEKRQSVLKSMHIVSRFVSVPICLLCVNVFMCVCLKWFIRTSPCVVLRELVIFEV